MQKMCKDNVMFALTVPVDLPFNLDFDIHACRESDRDKFLRELKNIDAEIQYLETMKIAIEQMLHDLDKK